MQNNDDRNYFLLPPGMDPNFFPRLDGPKRLLAARRKMTQPGSMRALALASQSHPTG
ncbi:hypothetical protein ACU4GD_29740 [Cupriavidus basilensis]